MSISDTLRSWVTNWLFAEELNEALRAQRERYARLDDYDRGQHKRQLRVKPMQADDNIVINFCGKIIDTSVSMLVGGGVEFDFGTEETSPQEEWLDKVWEANKREILLHSITHLGSKYGTCYVKIMPDAIASPDGELLPRLVALNPAWLDIETAPEDMSRIEAYTIRWNYIGENGHEVARKEVTTRERTYQIEAGENDSYGQPTTIKQEVETGYWVIQNWEISDATSGHWQKIADDVQWPFEFPPIIHWQNLPDPESVYGISDIEDLIELQDRYNFVASNISKIIRYHAHPKTWARGTGVTGRAQWGPDEMITLAGSDAMIQNLEMQSDLASSRAFALELRQSLFALSRTVDLDSYADKLGALTNFGLRVLFMEALSKNSTKQSLYGDALRELNRRLLTLRGWQGKEAFGGKVQWTDPLPINEGEKTTSVVAEVGAGLISKQTGSTELGHDWETEQERFQGEQAAQTNIGSQLLTAFSQGR